MTEGMIVIMRFICDEMFGSLARWLRMSGYDVLYLQDVTDDIIIETAVREGRFILTRDKEIHRRFPHSLYMNENALHDQLRTVFHELGLNTEKRGSRCTSCNGLLTKADKKDVAELVPPFTYDNHETFYSCQDCGKIYWKGSHWKQIEGLLKNLKG